MGTAALVWRNAGLIKLFYDVCKGTATRRERETVTQALRDAGLNADAMVGQIAQSMRNHGHEDVASRIWQIEDEVQAQQA